MFYNFSSEINVFFHLQSHIAIILSRFSSLLAYYNRHMPSFLVTRLYFLESLYT